MCPYAPSVEYALRLANIEIAPSPPDPKQGKSYLATAITDGILPQRRMTLHVSSTTLDIQATTVRIPVFAFAYDSKTVVIRYDPKCTPDLNPDQLTDVLYLTMAPHVDPDDFEDHHDLDRERQETFRQAATIARAIIDTDPATDFADLLAQHVEQFYTTMPWPESATITSAKDGKITIMISP